MNNDEMIKNLWEALQETNKSVNETNKSLSKTNESLSKTNESVAVLKTEVQEARSDIRKYNGLRQDIAKLQRDFYAQQSEEEGVNKRKKSDREKWRSIRDTITIIFLIISVTFNILGLNHLIKFFN